ncbi:YhcN/YlaJ family sporulation lipoprotein [Caldalkalibacillus salinus]|uniref:YhcN/YlaJ family sporulation lipoprotein n=1 Tax=Caldalkalibacillus salinus TaxID=2803787 RepID=UPI001F01C855|nr:YhcN/YlaJ family sporulation lipoprotein [Caldalkalibacillus salinus]
MKKTRFRLLMVLLGIAVLTACNPQSQTQPYQNHPPTSYDQNPQFESETYDGRQSGQMRSRDRDLEGIYSYDQALPHGSRRAPMGGQDGQTNNMGNADRNQQGQQNGQQQQNQAKGQQQGQQDNNNMRAPQSPNQSARAQEIADRLADLATQVDQVNDATAVVVGRYAVVGIDVDAELDRSKVGSIKYSVAEALKADPRGAYAVVTADVDTYYRLQEMGEEIRNGRPLAGVMDELAGIVGRLMPQLPRQVEKPDGGQKQTPAQGNQKQKENQNNNR